MAAEIVQLANANRVALTGEEIAPQVQKILQTGLMNTAERPPSPQQLQSIAKDCETLRLPEVPEMSTMLQASLWKAYNAPNRVELLEATTVNAEALLAPQQSPTQAASPSFDDGPSFEYDSGPSMDF
jgi:hypothetical protein